MLDDESIVSPALIKFALVSGLGGLLFGYDTGVASGALLLIGTDLTGVPLTTFQEEFIVSSTLLGALFSSLLASKLADYYGRKKPVVLAAILFAGGALLQGMSFNYWQCILGRFIVGIAVGLASMVIPIYISELSGALVGSLVVLITFGQVIAYSVDAIFYTTPQGWRYMFAFGALPALLQLLLLFDLPESPRYDISIGNFNSARSTLTSIYPHSSSESIDNYLTSLRNQLRLEHDILNDRLIQLEGNSTYRMFVIKFWNNRPNRRALILACGLQLIQQLTGFNTIIYYSGKILQQAGFDKPLMLAILIAGANFIFTILALQLVDKIGRRPLLILSLTGMIIGMFSMALSFPIIPSSPGPSTTSLNQSFLTLLSTIFFCSSYAIGLGNIPWIIQSEIFEFDSRAIGNGLATGFNWSGNLIVSGTFLGLMKAITPTKTFGLYGFISILSLVFVYLYLPETKGLDLEAVRALFMREGDEIIGRGGRSRNEGYETIVDDTNIEGGRE